MGSWLRADYTDLFNALGSAPPSARTSRSNSGISLTDVPQWEDGTVSGDESTTECVTAEGSENEAPAAIRMNQVAEGENSAPGGSHMLQSRKSWRERSGHIQNLRIPGAAEGVPKLSVATLELGGGAVHSGGLDAGELGLGAGQDSGPGSKISHHPRRSIAFSDVTEAGGAWEKHTNKLGVSFEHTDELEPETDAAPEVHDDPAAQMEGEDSIYNKVKRFTLEKANMLVGIGISAAAVICVVCCLLVIISPFVTVFFVLLLSSTVAIFIVTGPFCPCIVVICALPAALVMKPKVKEWWGKMKEHHEEVKRDRESAV